MIAGLLNSLLGLLADDMNMGKGASELQKLGQDQLARSNDLVKSLDRLNGTMKSSGGRRSKPGPGQYGTGFPGPKTTTLGPAGQPIDYMTKFRNSMKARTGNDKKPSSTKPRVGNDKKPGFFGTIQNWKKNVKGEAGGVDIAMSDKATQALGKTLAAFSKVAIVGTVAVAAAKAIVDMTKAAYQFVGQQSESNRRLAMYSGKLAASFAQMDLGQMRRDMQLARRTEGSAAQLNKARNDLENALQPIYEDLAIIANVAATVVAKTMTVATEVGKEVSDIYGIIHNASQLYERQVNKNNAGDFAPIEDWLNDNRVPGAGKPREPLPPIVKQ